MKNHLTADDLFSYVLMLRAAEDRVVLLVEGDSDCGALENLVSSSTVNLIPGHGKENVKGAIAIADLHDLVGVLAILDRDWTDLLEDRLTSPNVVYTDYYDIDATIFFSGSVAGRVVANFSDRYKIEAFLARVSSDDFAGWCVRVVLPLGVLRFVSQRDGLGLGLSDFPVGEVMANDYSAIDFSRMISIAYARARLRPSVAEADIRELLMLEMATLGGAASRYCCGHDIAKALSSALQKHGGASEGSKSIAKAIRAAFGEADLKSTQLYTKIRLLSERIGTKIWVFE